MDLAEGQEALVGRCARPTRTRSWCWRTATRPRIDWEQENVPAILWTTHAGQETGHALADVLFGDVNPAGRLTQTWYRSDADLPDILDYDIIKTDRTYLYYQGDPLYPFGHGLSYTTFRLRASCGSPRRGRPTARSRQRRRHQHRPPRRRRGRAALHPPADVAGQAAGQAAARVPAGAPRAGPDAGPCTLARRRRATWRSGTSPATGAWSSRPPTTCMVGALVRRHPASAPRVRVRGETIPPRDLTRVTRAEPTSTTTRASTLVDETKVARRRGRGRGRRLGAFARRLARLGRDDVHRAYGGGRRPARVEVRLDSPAGPVVGTAQVAPTDRQVHLRRPRPPRCTAPRGTTTSTWCSAGTCASSTFSLR